ncbi:MAG TPA: cytochrome c [Tepidisphaeraceae bacterium]|nr:cytochrome c [Tepidisphaeraceae bacterium]
MSDQGIKLGSLEPHGELPRPPFFMISILLILTVSTWIPLVVFARARVGKSPDPRVHLVQDMASQPKYKAQDPSDVFADGRAMRIQVPGTIAREQLHDDDHFDRGFTPVLNPTTKKIEPKFFEALPASVPLDEALLKRGQERFNIYCAVCHGLDGGGNGPINARAALHQEPKWVSPANLNSDAVRARPDGHLFNTITNGIRNMAGYGSQIPTRDRWAIVAYVRALQLSQHAPSSEIPADQLNAMK